MLKRFFITGTDTSVGKTVVSRALLQALASSGKSVAGYKPVAKGSKETAEGMRNKDALVLQSVSSLELPYEAINPIALSEEESSVAHSCPINYTLLSNGLASLSDKVDHVVVEGTGGWRSLMNDLRPLSEWVVQEQLPVLMVVGIQEGCINHALLTAQAVANDGLPLIGWVANRINPGLAHYAEINALMATSGMYQNAGEFAWRVGLPAKSGVGGGIVAIVPHEMAIAVWSPELDPAGNSLAGIAALEQLTQTLGRSVY